MTKKSQNKMDKRSILLNSDIEDKKIVHIDNPKIDVELRSISIGELEKLRKKAKINIEDPNESEVYPFLIWAIIYCSYDPVTGEKLFDEADYERFLELKANNEWFVKLSQEVAQFVGTGGDAEERKKH